MAGLGVLVHEAAAGGANLDGGNAARRAAGAHLALGMVAKAQAREVAHVPQVGAHLHGHLDAVAGVQRGGAGIQVGELRVVLDHDAVGLKAAAGQAHAALGAHGHALAVLLHVAADDRAGLVADELHAGAAQPHVEVLALALVDVLAQLVVVARVMLAAAKGVDQRVLGALELGELVPDQDPARTVDAHERLDLLEAGAALVHPVGLLGPVHHVGVAVQDVDHPIPVLGGAVGVGAQTLGVVVGVVAHEVRQVGVELVGVVGREDHLAGDLGVAGLLARGGLLAEEHLGALFIGGDGRAHAGTAHAQDHDVVLLGKLDARGGGLVCQGGGASKGRHGGGSQGGALHEVAAGDSCCGHTVYLLR